MRKILFIFFCIHKIVNKLYHKHKERLQKETRNIKIFLKKKEIKGKKKKTQVRYQSFTEEEKEKRYQHYVERKKRLPDYRRN